MWMLNFFTVAEIKKYGWMCIEAGCTRDVHEKSRCKICLENTMKDIRDEILKTISGIPIKKIRLNQEIVNNQLSEKSTGYGKCKLNQTGKKRLIRMQWIYQAAVDIIEFDGDIDTWVDRIIKNTK